MKALTSCSASLLAVCLLRLGHAEEPDDSHILKQIFQTRDAILKQIGTTNAAGSNVFLAFWDFDGTTLEGDCSEGLKAAGKPIYPGLAQLAIEHNLSEIYPCKGGFERFWGDYTNMEARIGRWLAYPFVVQMLRGAYAEDVLQLSRQHFQNTLSNHMMASSLKMIHALAQGGVEPHVVSASAELFVKGASDSLGIPAGHIHGIEVRIRDGRVTEEIVYPVTWNAGKLEKIKQIVGDIEHQQPGRKVFVLAGFGDSYHTDGPFLRFIATQSLPAGKPIAVFYNSAEDPGEYRGLFYQAHHSATVNDKPGP